MAAALAMGSGAMAAEAPPAEKVALARQLVESSGGADQMKTVLQTVFRSMGQSLSANMPSEQKRITEVLLQKMQDRFIAALPQMIDGTVQIYAQNLTDKELRDYLAWMQSDSGQSLKRKLPQLTTESLKVMAPLLTQVTQGMKQDVIDETCKQAQCTAHDREVLVSALDKAIPKQPG